MSILKRNFSLTARHLMMKPKAFKTYICQTLEAWKLGKEHTSLSDSLKFGIGIGGILPLISGGLIAMVINEPTDPISDIATRLVSLSLMLASSAYVNDRMNAGRHEIRLRADNPTQQLTIK